MNFRNLKRTFTGERPLKITTPAVNGYRSPHLGILHIYSIASGLAEFYRNMGRPVLLEGAIHFHSKEMGAQAEKEGLSQAELAKCQERAHLDEAKRFDTTLDSFRCITPAAVQTWYLDLIGRLDPADLTWREVESPNGKGPKLFFRLSRYQEALRERVLSGELAIEPQYYREECLRYLDNPRDFCDQALIYNAAQGGYEINAENIPQTVRTQSKFPRFYVPDWLAGLLGSTNGLEVDENRFMISGGKGWNIAALIAPAFYLSQGAKSLPPVAIFHSLVMDGKTLRKSRGADVETVDRAAARTASRIGFKRVQSLDPLTRDPIWAEDHFDIGIDGLRFNLVRTLTADHRVNLNEQTDRQVAGAFFDSISNWLMNLEAIRDRESKPLSLHRGAVSIPPYFERLLQKYCESFAAGRLHEVGWALQSMMYALCCYSGYYNTHYEFDLGNKGVPQFSIQTKLEQARLFALALKPVLPRLSAEIFRRFGFLDDPEARKVTYKPRSDRLGDFPAFSQLGRQPATLPSSEPESTEIRIPPEWMNLHKQLRNPQVHVLDFCAATVRNVAQRLSQIAPDRWGREGEFFAVAGHWASEDLRFLKGAIGEVFAFDHLLDLHREVLKDPNVRLLHASRIRNPLARNEALSDFLLVRFHPEADGQIQGRVEILEEIENKATPVRMAQVWSGNQLVSREQAIWLHKGALLELRNDAGAWGKWRVNGPNPSPHSKRLLFADPSLPPGGLRRADISISSLSSHDDDFETLALDIYPAVIRANFSPRTAHSVDTWSEALRSRIFDSITGDIYLFPLVEPHADERGKLREATNRLGLTLYEGKGRFLVTPSDPEFASLSRRWFPYRN